MKIYAILIYNATNQKIISEFNLDEYNFLHRISIKEFLIFGSNLVYNQTNQTNQTNQIEIVSYKEYQINIYNKTWVLITDKDYSNRILTDLFNQLKINELNESNDLKKFISEDYYNKDPLIKINTELDNTIIIVKKTIDSLLNRGIALDSLVEKSENLGLASKLFYKSAKNQNKCCCMS
jgi:synaptobrevin family protein YKT6